MYKAGKDKNNKTTIKKYQIIKVYDNIFACSKKSFWDIFISWDNRKVKEGSAINVNLIKEASAFAERHNKKFVVILKSINIV